MNIIKKIYDVIFVNIPGIIEYEMKFLRLTVCFHFRRVHISEKTMSFLDGEFEVEPAFGEKREEALRLAGIKTYFIVKELKPVSGNFTHKLVSYSQSSITKIKRFIPSRIVEIVYFDFAKYHRRKQFLTVEPKLRKPNVSRSILIKRIARNDYDAKRRKAAKSYLANWTRSEQHRCYGQIRSRRTGIMDRHVYERHTHLRLLFRGHVSVHFLDEDDRYALFD